MKLSEWKNAQGNKVGQGATNINNKSFKKRFDKIIQYYGQHLPAEVDYVTVNLLNNSALDFTESYNDASTVRYNIDIEPTTEAWRLKIFMNDKIKDDLSGTGWPELLKILRPYITVPVTTTSEYKDLLTEWLDSSGQKVNPASVVPTKTSSTSSGYKKRFEKLIKYHIDHASSKLESITQKDISNWHFRLGEHFNTGSREFDREIALSFDKNTDTFYLNIFVDSKQVYHKDYKSYEEVLETLIDTYMYLPGEGTEEYNDLLTESLSIADDFKLYENLWD